MFCENTTTTPGNDANSNEADAESNHEKAGGYNWTDSEGNYVNGRLSVKPGGHLEVKAARDEDSGIYTCTLNGRFHVNKTLTGNCSKN